MGDEIDLEGTSLIDQFVLCCLAAMEEDGQTPVQTHELRHFCRDVSAAPNGGVVGTPSEADVMRALNRLEAANVVEERSPSSSPVGKGRPEYLLEVEPETVYESVDDVLEGVFE